MMTTSFSSNRASLLLRDLQEVEAAQQSLPTNNGENLQSISIVVGHPRLITPAAAENNNGTAFVSLKTLLQSLSSYKSLQEIRLSIRGAGKSGTQEENTFSADALAELLQILSPSSLLISLELVISKLQGSVTNLATAIQTCSSSLERVVLHECDTDTPRDGLLPLIHSLSQTERLQSLIIENVQFPVGDSTANALQKLAFHPHLQRLEIKQCDNLSDRELIPLVSSIRKLKHLKLSTGLFQLLTARTGGQQQRPWGNALIQALAKTLSSWSNDNVCELTSLAITTTPDVDLMPIVQAMERNTSVKRLTLYNGKHNNNNDNNNNISMIQEMTRILTTQNMTLEHCNHLGGSFSEYETLAFYTRLNQCHRKELWEHSHSCPQQWWNLLLQEHQDHRIVHYLLSNHPGMIG